MYETVNTKEAIVSPDQIFTSSDDIYNFLCYNDAFVSQTNLLDAMASKVSERAEEKRTPYILLYHYLK